MNLKKNLTDDEKFFMENGYIVKDIEDHSNINKLSKKIFDYSKELLGSDFDLNNDLEFFNNIHKNLEINNLNNFRVGLINKINSNNEIKEKLYYASKPYLNELVGNELVIQRRLNLSIQFPKDDSSLLPIHADTWSGDSPFEIVTWIPLVDCYKTKSMYLLPPKYYDEFKDNFNDFTKVSAGDLFQKIANKVEWIKIKYGQVMLFNQSLPHGNITNEEQETRWSLNCRFKSLFSPYGDKKLGEFFEPISTKLMTKIGMNYKYPVSE